MATKDIKYGFIDKTGRFVIEPKYDEAGVFSEGLAYVKKGESHYYIDKSGRIVIELDKECVNGGGSFHEGIATISGYNKMGIIDRSGRQIGNWISGAISGFHEGLSLVKTGPALNLCGFIDHNGQFVIEPQFRNALDFHEGRARVTFDKQFEGNPKCGYIDKTGRMVIPPKFKLEPLASPFSEGLAVVNVGSGCRPMPNDRRGYIDKTGQFVIEPKFITAMDFHEGLAYVNLGNNRGRGFIDKTGQLVFLIEDRFGFVGNYSEGVALVEIDRKYGYLDKTGRLVIEPRFEYASPFKDGVAAVLLGGKYGFIDKMGQFIIEPQYEEEPTEFYEGLARVKVEREVRQTYAVNNYQSTQKTQQRSMSSSTKQNTKSGCYIATAVYGSYNCPEVWTLRRYRDNVLNNSWYGKLFIRTYYAISPTLVKWFGTTNWFRNLFIVPLNKWVTKLNKRGFENTPYSDKY